MFHRLSWGWKGQWLELAQQGKEKRGDSWTGETTRQETDSGDGRRRKDRHVTFADWSSRYSVCMSQDEGEMQPTLGGYTELF